MNGLRLLHREKKLVTGKSTQSSERSPVANLTIVEKVTDFYKTMKIPEYADSMSSLPRKILGCMTPEELFEAFLDQLYSVTKVPNVS